ncbi:hypothetical protein JCGZ_11825 [Jatropha curcas]|uniref:Uncharacterized protein n=1 Tax=Jatropha curcas TaxID=180498 RepID=A0A067KHX4_JATCU|nr:hypothetical protein JCGZ_11825 [Jatropha curcas]
MVGWFEIEHFQTIHSRTGVPYNSMLIFDDEDRNIQAVLDRGKKIELLVDKTVNFRQQDACGINWKSITVETKDRYWREFKKKCKWDAKSEAMIKRAWYRQAANRSSDFVSQLKKKGRKSYIKDEVWDKWTEYWKTPEAIKKLEIFSKNRRFERGGEESGLSLHTGGSISALDTNNTSIDPPNAVNQFVIPTSRSRLTNGGGLRITEDRAAQEEDQDDVSLDDDLS